MPVAGWLMGTLVVSIFFGLLGHIFYVDYRRMKSIRKDNDRKRRELERGIS